MEKTPNNEATKTTGRIGIFGAISSLVTYAIQTYFPDMPNEVITAILVLLMAGLTYADSYIHHNKDTNINGLTTF